MSHYYRGLHSTPLPALMSADIALASVYTKSASILSQSALPPRHPGRARKLSEPIEPTPLRRRRSSAGSVSSRQTDGSDSDDPKGELGEKPSGPVRRRTQSFLPLGTQTKRKTSGSDLQSIDESSKKAVAAANSRTFRPAYMYVVVLVYTLLVLKFQSTFHLGLDFSLSHSALPFNPLAFKLVSLQLFF